MKKCKNVECENEVKENRTYCSLTCRNVYVNKHLRDYSKNGAGLSGKKEYYENPKKCEKCNSIILYEKRRGKYCNHSCAASETNKIRVISEEEKVRTNEKRREKMENKYRGEIIENIFIKCKCCENEIKSNLRIKFCSISCKKNFQRRNMTEFQKYKRDCLFKFNLADYEDEFDFSLIEKYGWYKATNNGNNLDGISRDHMYSIRDGFDNNIDPKLISHPANCKKKKLF